MRAEMQVAAALAPLVADNVLTPFVRRSQNQVVMNDKTNEQVVTLRCGGPAEAWAAMKVLQGVPA